MRPLCSALTAGFFGLLFFARRGYERQRNWGRV